MSKVRDLQELTTPEGADYLYAVDVSAGPNAGRKVSITNIKTALNSTAAEITYNNATSGLAGTNLQSTTDELAAKGNAHSSRHLPDGSDGLSIGTPSTIGESNSVGTSNNFSRGNHSHDHGSQTNGDHHAAATTSVNGFLPATDKVKLNKIGQGFIQYVNSGVLSTSSLTFVAMSMDQDVDSDLNSLFTKTSATNFRTDFAGYVKVNFHATAYSDTNDRGGEFQLYRNASPVNGAKGKYTAKNVPDRPGLVAFEIKTPCAVNDIFTIQYRSTEGALAVVAAGYAKISIECHRLA